MALSKRQRNKGRREGGSFSALPHRVQESENYRRCSPAAKGLLADLLYQYRGNNNGDLAVCEGVLRRMGWKSKHTIYRARDELEHYGLIMLTRRGGRNNTPHLYAITWQPIDECSGKLDAAFSEHQKVPPGLWREPRPDKEDA